MSPQINPPAQRASHAASSFTPRPPNFSAESRSRMKAKSSSPGSAAASSDLASTSSSSPTSPPARVSKLNEMEEHRIKIQQKSLVAKHFIQSIGYQIFQQNAQRVSRCPQAAYLPEPTDGELYIFKMPRDMFEDELFPVLSSFGHIYNLRLVMDFSGSGKGFAYVKYSVAANAERALRYLGSFSIRPNVKLAVTPSFGRPVTGAKKLKSVVSRKPAVIITNINLKEYGLIFLYKFLTLDYSFAVDALKIINDATVSVVYRNEREALLMASVINNDWIRLFLAKPNTLVKAEFMPQANTRKQSD